MLDSYLWFWIYQRVRSIILELDIGIQIRDLHLFQPGVNNIGYGIAIIQTLFVSLLIGGEIYFLTVPGSNRLGLHQFSKSLHKVSIEVKFFQVRTSFSLYFKLYFCILFCLFWCILGIRLDSRCHQIATAHSAINATGSPTAPTAHSVTSSTPSTARLKLSLALILLNSSGGSICLGEVFNWYNV